ncbi:aminotransferase class V-fold PLP-dependent enzyme [Parapedobacter lycopersici]|uniref:aminotransferase class V-fold PLP-dependent enzyme n=1 Tax=Parapedobacter lycopersici TaxID=1864939 RepID=UPI003341F12E
MMKRREVLKTLAVLPLSGSVAPTALLTESPVPDKRNLFKELGLRTFINAAGVYTSMSASLMPEEVLEAITTGAGEYVMLDDVQDKVGEKIAELCHAEAAMVTAGCWSALVLGMAGVLTGMDMKKVAQLPFLPGTGMKSKVILQKSHATGYHLALSNAGVSFVMAETRREVENAIDEDTAMMWFLNREAPSGAIQHEEWIEIARKHGIPTMIDIASDVPPVENLWKYNDMGFDLVAISGGKAMRGPQSAGILMGKRNLIAAARLNAPPRSGIARGQKVNKEEILGMYVTVERYINLDHEKEWRLWEDQVALIEKTAKGVDGVMTTVFVPPVANHTPTLNIYWAKDRINISGNDLRQRLRDGSPSIEVRNGENDGIELTVFMLKPGQERIVAQRISEELRSI